MISRSRIRRHLPEPLLDSLRNLRDRLNPPVDGVRNLRDYGFEAEDNPKPRVSLVLNTVSREFAFGGKATAVAIFEELAAPLAAAGVDLRIVTDAPYEAAMSMLSGTPLEAQVSFASVEANGGRIATRRREIFIAYNWWLSANLQALRQAQAVHFGQAPRPKVHLLQEYEPGFFGYSAAHMVAHEAISGDDLWAVINTRELQDYWEMLGHHAQRTYCFEPHMNAALRPFADGIAPAEKTRTVLVYGRPTIPRNAFFLVERGLQAWAERHGANHRDWRFVSAGLPHPDIALGNGHSLTSVGKLSLEAYARLLRETALGVSLMVSPHPSYPPLEMAHFGARVLTNDFTGKRVVERHPNIVRLPSVSGPGIAETLEAEIVSFEADPGAAVHRKPADPAFLTGGGFDFVPQLAADLVEALNH
ncbi:rhamnosyltransferase WsaF family glycosyltransferase [Ovoidimarina sediminis]|uniref:rhamnosyltransferase WsaF family glycosyltransferase n=1 Tax=Ovoidimarina sediminis TaxID=3079856 RepID=UPI0029147CEB|nr:hypothetical protein [Rhodophyticola sp. MJ-SS7]MDU8943275.1 hypothetical protein [Rhodophyticola sp. MJ-SS7]